MYIDRISDMIAHFIGVFETLTDEARLRIHHAEGAIHSPKDVTPPPDEVVSLYKDYDVALEDFDPGVKYRAETYDLDYYGGYYRSPMFREGLDRLADTASQDLITPHFAVPGSGANVEDKPELVLHVGPGSVIAHVSQFNLLQDDDYLDMTSGNHAPRETAFVTIRTTEYYNEAAQFTPFSTLHRTDTFEGVQTMTESVHDYIEHARDADTHSLGTDADQDFVLADHGISGTYINGVQVNERPDVDDYMPDRGIAKPASEPEKSDVPLEDHNPPGNTLEVAAGANVVANIVAVTETAVISPVIAVTGDYHQIDVITQAYIYSDRDEVGSGFSQVEDHVATVANNIASFDRSVWSNGAAESDTEDGKEAIFPTAWRVSYIDGDVSFVHWIEQYHFISDNDTMTMTTSGVDITVLTGGNAALNLSTLLGIGMQYDLVIVGGNIIDMNMIAQIAVLYDNDWTRALEGSTSGASVQSGNNLIWNEASIHNVGSNDRFDTMPGYIADTIRAIDERDADMPGGLSSDPNFAGYAGLNVLYITGNLFDVTYVKQVSVLGDSDDVNLAASQVLANNENATIHIDTGSNAIVNIAQIVDYDSFGGSTYVGGQLYSDAILIQGGIIEEDTSQAHPSGDRLANEVIAFLDDDHPTDNNADIIITSGHDLTWSQAHPVDVMQTAVA